MPPATKPISSVTESEFRHHAIWEFVGEITSDEMDESWASAVLNLPVRSLVGRVVATNVTLANGSIVFAVLSNIDCLSAEKTSVFLTISFFKDRSVFHLARYFDEGFDDEAGPTALAQFLRLEMADIFPIQYDLTHLALGNVRALKGSILAIPETRLSDDERIRLIVQS